MMGIMHQQPEKERGFLFIAFAILIFVTTPVSAITYFAMPEAIMSVHPKATIAILYLLGGLSILSMVFAALFWYWKRIGLYGFYAVLAMSLVIRLYLNVDSFELVIGAVGGVLMFYIVKERWQEFV